MDRSYISALIIFSNCFIDSFIWDPFDSSGASSDKNSMNYLLVDDISLGKINQPVSIGVVVFIILPTDWLRVKRARQAKVYPPLTQAFPDNDSLRVTS